MKDPMQDLPLTVIKPVDDFGVRWDRMGRKAEGPKPTPGLEFTKPQTQPVSKKPGLLDSVIFALMGTPDAALAPEDAKARGGRRAEAGQMAANAANGDLGDSFMKAPSTGGSGFGLNDIISVVSKML
jgi:hypothetical protein